MESFSQRKGITPVKSILQVDSMDDELRNSIWNSLVYLNFRPSGFQNDYIPDNGSTEDLFKKLWFDYFKQPLDKLGNPWLKSYNETREYFFKGKWWEVYDFMEFCANNYPDNEVNLKFMESCNSILKRELSAYRFVGGKITQVTNEEEIAEIEKVLQVPISPVQEHINRALELLSDRKSPDYRNSIKESISAVEAICQLIAKNKKATLTLALDTIAKGKKVEMHPALKTAFEKLYGYTNAAEGIRHALSDEPNLDFEDAKFMLVSCSGFINYLIVKSSKAGITL
jgi:hypothetical protein